MQQELGRCLASSYSCIRTDVWLVCMRPWHRGTNNIKDLQDRRDLQGVEIKAVVVGGLRGGCAGDRSTATNPPAGAFHHHSWTPGLRFVGPEGTQRGFNESPTQPVACSALLRPSSCFSYCGVVTYPLGELFWASALVQYLKYPVHDCTGAGSACSPQGLCVLRLFQPADPFPV